VLDPSTGILEYASAGHLPMLMVSAAGETTWLDEAQSAPLFGGDAGLRPQATTTLETGALLVLYSDGLVERRGERLADGLERLARVGRFLRDVPVQEVCDVVAAALGVDTSRDDDVAVLAVRFEPVTAASYRRTFPARAEELSALRDSMRAWLDQRGIADSPTRGALLVTVGEACANAIEHAYLSIETGDVDVEITVDGDGALFVRVRDSGRFRQSSEPRPDRGRGTEIMRRLSVDFSRDSTPQGTLVRFRVPVHAPLLA
jgi:anti-sigma regulatory factor (Ser/Thr protein kinase)